MRFRPAPVTDTDVCLRRSAGPANAAGSVRTVLEARMDWEEDERMDRSAQTVRAVRPDRPQSKHRRDSLRTPADAAEVARRVAIYAEQVRRDGRIAWLPHRDTLQDME